MTTSRSKAVTEMDFRMPEFIGKDPKDYEFRGDGKVVRKDRWENAIHSIRHVVCDAHAREFEISEVVDAVKALVKSELDWVDFDANKLDHIPLTGEKHAIDVKLQDRSILIDVNFSRLDGSCLWKGFHVDLTEIESYRAG